MSSEHVFFDPEGRRRKRVGFWAASLGVIVAFVTTAFIVSLFVVPLLPRVKGLTEGTRHPNLVPRLPDVNKRASLFLASKVRQELNQEIVKDNQRRELEKRSAAKSAAGSPIVAAFYTPWEEVGITSFRANATKLTHVFPVWLHTGHGDPGEFDATDFDPALYNHNPDLIDIARRSGVRIWPVFSNLKDDKSDTQIVGRLLASPEAQVRLANSLRDWLKKNRFDGLNVDFEELSRADYERLPEFLAVLRKTLHESQLGLSLDLEAGNAELDLAALAKNVDLAIAMVYDEHFEGGAAGPIASVDWSSKALSRFGAAIPANKLVLGVGSYAYDWTGGKPGASAKSYQAALKDAEGYRDEEPASDVIDLDQTSLNAHFTYEDDENVTHQVWMLDGVSAFNQWKIARSVGVRGSALWSLGTEDPSVWRFLNRDSIMEDPVPSTVETIEFGPNELEYRGSGEILYVEGEPATARRALEIDRDSGLIVDETYQGYPSSTFIRRAGYQGPKTVALTFDDGPDSNYTPQILDILQRYRIPATFFVIGRNAEQFPDLVQRTYDEGHELGSHTFNHPNLDETSDRRIELELNATQRVIQGITGHTTVMFRPPFNADSEPTKPDDIHAINVASGLGYVTVGESIDPQDWRLNERIDNTGPRRTPQEIVDAILYQLSLKDHGNIVLLHDGGGDRSTTVAALKILIPALQTRGYSFVPVSRLLGTNRNGVMPAITDKDRVLIGLDKFVFGAIFTFEWLLRLAFIVAIALGLARVLMVVPLALMHSARKRHFNPAFRPTVSVLIAAYNEEKVIARTVKSILDSEYPVNEVIVVDDGSKDGTFLEIVTQYSMDPRVVALRQENGGKASALNRALSQARGEILVCVDADTQLKPDAIGLLVRPFEDRSIGAVAGNVKVGNRVNLLTIWQSIEYITSQNVDRRAYSVLNGITVVPGAIGAWRRSAVVEAGGLISDTLAEDMDLTWRLRRAGWKMETESAAIAYTEVPDSLGGFFRQRFRWAFGTLQCLSKHRRALFKHGWFGWVTLPTLWLFQVVFQVLGPLVDLQIAYTSALFLIAWISRNAYSKDWRPVADVGASLSQFAFYYGLFFTVELAAGFVAYRLDKERTGSLWWLFLQRFVYRQVMYVVIYKSIVNAIRGRRQGWGKLERKATVSMDRPVDADDEIAAKR